MNDRAALRDLYIKCVAMQERLFIDFNDATKIPEYSELSDSIKVAGDLLTSASAIHEAKKTDTISSGYSSGSKFHVCPPPFKSLTVANQHNTRSTTYYFPELTEQPSYLHLSMATTIDTYTDHYGVDFAIVYTAGCEHANRHRNGGAFLRYVPVTLNQ